MVSVRIRLHVACNTIPNIPSYQIYLSLDHVAPPSPHRVYESKHIHTVLYLYLFQLSKQSDECASPSYTSTAVDHDGPSVSWVGGGYFSHKVE